MATSEGSTRDERIAWLLEDNIRTELIAHNAGWNLGLSDAAIRGLAEGIASEILYAFEVDWRPDWVGPGDVHGWQIDGVHFARCAVCLADSPPSEDHDTARRWAAAHEVSHSAAT